MKRKTSVLGVSVSWWFILAVVALSGCGKTETPVPVTPGGPAPAGAPVANAPVSGRVIRLADGVDLSQIANQQMIHPLFRVVPPASDSIVIFAVLQNDQKNAAAPVILKQCGNAWKITELTEAPQQEWAYVASGPSAAELWGILDASGENEIDHLTVLHSTDGGGSWQFLAGVRKISEAADYSAFSIDKAGKGRLTMHILEDDEDIIHGYYHYSTADHGKTWLGPTFESDDTTDAESLKSVPLPEALKVAAP